MSVFDRLTRVQHTDNLCTVGWTNIWAHGWDEDTVTLALWHCPHGKFSATTYVSSDQRRVFDPRESKQAKRYGVPVFVLRRGAYFDFPMDAGALQLMQRLDLINELMVLRADGGRHRWPEEEKCLHSCGLLAH